MGLARTVMQGTPLVCWLYPLVCIFRPDSFLAQSGWFRSCRVGRAETREGCPCPWYTYSAISFLENRINSNMTVFEWGSGMSTLWWAEKVKEVITCEHEKQWYERMKRGGVPPNVRLNHVSLTESGKYSNFVLECGGTFDIIVIDGRERVNCVRKAVNALKRGGVIVWDNSDRDKYRDGYAYLKSKRYKKLDFFGMGPVNRNAWCTTVFYQDENCLCI